MSSHSFKYEGLRSLLPKKIDIYLTKIYIGPFILTFFVSLFVLVMQFLWKYIDDMIGKGISNDVIFELLFYASASLAPMALPLAILLSSIMTFGNLGESFELTAAKASGISLIRFMLSLIIFSIIISIFAFFFSNHILPKANLKYQQILYDVRRLKPALNVKPHIFNNSLDGITMRIESKDEKKNIMYGILIYDHSANKGNDNVLMAERGELLESKDGNTLILKLYKGKQYREKETNMLFAEKFENYVNSFDTWEKRFDLTQFKMQKTNENYFKNLNQMLSLGQLNAEVDSVKFRIKEKIAEQDLYTKQSIRFFACDSIRTVPIMSLDGELKKLDKPYRHSLYEMALNSARNMKSFYNIQEKELDYKQNEIRNIDIERHRKFTLAVACFVLFFVGAPLGAIIRKGGLGWPMFFSVLFFIIFHVSGIIGEKMAEHKSLTAMQGMWMATSLFMPLGIFLTYKAKNDSALYNFETYQIYFQRGFKFLKEKFSKK